MFETADAAPVNEDVDHGPRSSGVGRVFVAFADASSAEKALKSLHGRSFSDRRVEASYFPEDKFLGKEYAA